MKATTNDDDEDMRALRVDMGRRHVAYIAVAGAQSGMASNAITE